MSDERYPRGDRQGRSDPQDYIHDYASGRDYTATSARDYAAAGEYGRDRGNRQQDRGNDYGARNFRGRDGAGREDYGRDYNRGAYAGEGFGGASYGELNQGQSRYGAGGYSDSPRNRESANRSWGEERYGASAYGGPDRDSYLGQTRGGSAYDGGERFGGEARGRQDDYRPYGGRGDAGRGGYQGSYSADGHRFAENEGRSDRGAMGSGYSTSDRGFLARAGDELRSWFGDDEAQRRREQDQRFDGQGGTNGERVVGGFEGERVHFHHDRDYHQWRQNQIDAIDRDYHEYRQENHQKFANEFGAFRTERQSQRQLLDKVEEHHEVVGSDGEHIGTVDKVRGDRIILTKSDRDAGDHHHSIPSRWLQSVEDKVIVRKTAAETKAHWRDEERNSAMTGENQDRGFGRGGNQSGGSERPTLTTGTGSSPALAAGTGASGSRPEDSGGPHVLDKSFSGTR